MKVSRNVKISSSCKAVLSLGQVYTLCRSRVYEFNDYDEFQDTFYDLLVAITGVGMNDFRTSRVKSSSVTADNR